MTEVHPPCAVRSAATPFVPAMATFVMNGCSFVQLSIWSASTCNLLAAVCDRAVATEVLLLKSGSSVVAAGLPWLRGEFSCSKEEAAECTTAHAVASRNMRPTPMTSVHSGFLPPARLSGQPCVMTSGGRCKCATAVAISSEMSRI